MDNQLSPTNAPIGAQLEQEPSVIMTELQRVEQAVYNLYSKLDTVLATVPSSTQTEPSSHLLSSRLRLISTTLEHILTNIEL